MSRLTKVIAGVAGITLLLAGCGTSGGTNDLDLVTPGTLTICSDLPYAPFEFEDPSTESGYSGFDIDLVAAIAENLGLKVEVIVSGFDSLQSGAALAAGQCDMGASAITITEERRANIDFSDPYYDSLQSLMVPVALGVNNLSEMGGKRIGVQTGTTGQIFATENAPSDAVLVDFADDGLMWLAIQAGQVDALLQDLPINVEHTRADPTYAIVEQYDTAEQYGFAFAKDKNPGLLKAVNTELKKLRDKGAYDTLYAKYFDSKG